VVVSELPQNNGVTVHVRTHTSKRGHTYKRRSKTKQVWNAPNFQSAYLRKLRELFSWRKS
jgi:hypothetical protein